MGEDQILETLVAHQDLFSTTQSIFILPFRLVGYALIHGLAWLVGAFEEAIRTLLGHLDFFSNTLVQEWFGSAQVIAWGLLIIGVILLGYQLLINRHREKSQIPVNILLCLLVIIGLPTLSGQLAQVTGAATTVFMGTGESTLAEELTKSFINDNKYIIEHGFSQEALDKGNDITAGSIFDIDVGELLKPEDVSIPSDQTQYGDILKWHLGSTVTGDKYLVESDMGGAWIVGDAFSNCYYRYQVDWFVLLLVLAGLLICMVFTAIKVGKIIFQIVYNLFFTIFVAPVDIAGGQRLKKCVEEVVYLYLTLMSIALMYRIYLIGVNWASSTFSGLTLGVLLLGMSWGLVDGPNLVQKLFGIDAGLSSVAHGIQSIYYGSRIAKDIGHAAANVAKKAGTVGAFGAGMFAGMKDAQKNPNFGSQQDRDAKNSPYTNNQLHQGGKQEKLNERNSLSSPDDGRFHSPESQSVNPPKNGGGSSHGSLDENQSGATNPTQRAEAEANTATTYDSLDQRNADSQGVQQEAEQLVYGNRSAFKEMPEQAVYDPGNEHQQSANSPAAQQAQQETEQAVYGNGSTFNETPEQAVYGNETASNETSEQAVYGQGNEYRQNAGSQTSQQAQQQQTKQAVYSSGQQSASSSSVRAETQRQNHSGSPGRPAETRTLGDVIRGSTAYGSRQSTAQDGRFAFMRTAYQIGHNTATQNIQRGQQNIQRLRQMGAPPSRPASSTPPAPPVPGTRYLSDNDRKKDDNSKKEDRR